MVDQTSPDAAPRSLRVLLVEDHADTAELLRILLGRRGFEVTVAGSVSTALLAAGAAPVDALVSDIHLPDGSGHDLLRQLRASGPLPAIALSGLAREADVESARAAGFDDYLGKPVSIDQLVAALRRVSGGSAPEASRGDPMTTDRTTHILLVDDDEIDVMNVRRALTKGKIESPLFHAGDGLAALEMLRGGDIPRGRRLVLLDLNMPRMNGIEFLRELRADPQLRSTAVVVLTTSDAERDRREAYGFHVAGYLVKPIRAAALVEQLETLHRYWTLMEMP
jgi:CheY-like chemotaxis protein